MAVKFTSAALCLLLPLVAAIPAELATSAAQESAQALKELAGLPVEITGISFTGPGCGPGSAHTYISPSKDYFEIDYDSFSASINFGTPSEVFPAKTNCESTVKLHVPQGFQFSIFKIETEGFLYLEPGIVATETSTYTFSSPLVGLAGSPPPSYIFGPKSVPYSIVDIVPAGSIVYSRCGEDSELKINTELKLKRQNEDKDKYKNGLFTVKDTEGKVKTKFSIQWRKCYKCPEGQKYCDDKYDKFCKNHCRPICKSPKVPCYFYGSNCYNGCKDQCDVAKRDAGDLAC